MASLEERAREKIDVLLRIDVIAPAHCGLSASRIHVARFPCGSVHRGEFVFHPSQ